MDVKITLLLFIAFGMTLARRRRVMKEQKPSTIVLIQNLIAPEAVCQEPRIECVKTCPACSMTGPVTYPVTCPSTCPSTYPVIPVSCKEELILPPQIAELPCGLGYFPTALPLVSRCYQPEVICQEAILPVTTGCSCMSLAAPLFTDYECLARPIIL